MSRPTPPHFSAARTGAPWAEPDLTGASLADLFTLYGHILDELTGREAIRTRINR